MTDFAEFIKDNGEEEPLDDNAMQSAQDQLGHATAIKAAHYVRHVRGKLVNPTKWIAQDSGHRGQ